MRHRRLVRPSPATVLALLALFVSLGGTTYAVTALPRNSVGSAQLRDRAVREAELGRGAVITSKLADRAVRRRKLALGAVTADRVAADALGGGQIDESALGAVPLARDSERALQAQRAALADSAARADRAAVADALGRIERKSELVEVLPEDDPTFRVPCSPGLVPVGGGFMADPSAIDIPIILGSAPGDDGWEVQVLNLTGGEPIAGRVHALCIEVVAP